MAGVHRLLEQDIAGGAVGPNRADARTLLRHRQRRPDLRPTRRARRRRRTGWGPAGARRTGPAGPTLLTEVTGVTAPPAGGIIAIGAPAAGGPLAAGVVNAAEPPAVAACAGA